MSRVGREEGKKGRDTSSTRTLGGGGSWWCALCRERSGSESEGNRGKFAQERAGHCKPRERKKKVKTS